MHGGNNTMATRYNPPPNWPAPPSGWTPPPGWQPDPAWGPAPPGWNVWVDDMEARRGTNKRTLKAVAIVLAGFLVIGVLGALFGGDDGTDEADTASTSSTPSSSSSSADPETSEPEATEVEVATPSPPAPATKQAFVFKPGTYKALTARGLARLVKNPDRQVRKKYILYGEVVQFDAVTGDDAFLANAGATKKFVEYGYVDYSENALFSATEKRFRKVVQGDVFKAYVRVVGSLSYDTQIGGNTTVPHLFVDRISVYDSTLD